MRWFTWENPAFVAPSSLLISFFTSLRNLVISLRRDLSKWIRSVMIAPKNTTMTPPSISIIGKSAISISVGTGTQFGFRWCCRGFWEGLDDPRGGFGYQVEIQTADALVYPVDALIY